MTDTAVNYVADLSGIDDFPRLAAAMNLSVSAMIRARAPALGRTLAAYMMPVADGDTGGGIDVNTGSFSGDSKMAQKLGQAAVARDILRVYMLLSQAYAAVLARKGKGAADSFYKLVKTGRLAEATTAYNNATGTRINVSPWDNGNLHARMRNSRGRVSRKSPLMIVPDDKVLQSYIREVQKRVGWAKSGFITAARSVTGGQGGRVPQWMSQPAPGAAIISEGVNTFSIELQDNVRYSGSVLDEHYYHRAIETFYNRIGKEADAVVAAVLRNHEHQQAA